LEAAVKPVQGFSMQVGQGKELLEPIVHELPSMARPIEAEAYYVVTHDARKGATVVLGGPYPTEARAFGDVSSITDTSGT
jgi:hypothetical protein